LTTFDIIQHNTFPRLAATAETGWSPASRKDYADFLQRLPVQLQRYRRLGIAYARTPFEVLADAKPDADGKGATVSLSTPLEYDIRYTLDGSVPVASSQRYAAPFDVPMPARIRAAVFSGDRRLEDDAGLDVHVDAASLHRREDTGMAACPNAPGPALRLAGSPDADGKRPLYNVDIMGPCWQWQTAPGAGMHHVRVRAARLPYTFRLTAAELAKRRFLPARTPEGELDIRSGSCDGPVVASAALPALTTTQGPADIAAALQEVPAATDLCIRFTGGTEHGLWVLDEVELLP
jgi:hexosaminidase